MSWLLNVEQINELTDPQHQAIVVGAAGEWGVIFANVANRVRWKIPLYFYRVLFTFSQTQNNKLKRTPILQGSPAQITIEFRLPKTGCSLAFAYPPAKAPTSSLNLSHVSAILLLRLSAVVQPATKDFRSPRSLGRSLLTISCCANSLESIAYGNGS
ncbi:hypothetical protein CpipJ_CPIJ009936 [Culex quinquefasciatus]|uniref:Uncharacterized protein n=1 Tax=Culex quinquefasciatus TaxID=7176 RepID=B0WSW6_CULQU|nr:hypothetical protein CpipJ_CPIJ009936 [Culex quinquefasciatus]|eukprot:XP_001870733.1 hypothetical protein CpipJ_CPIJ009936 [Culex quinquefasciatus]